MIMDTVYVCGGGNAPWFLVRLLPTAMLLATISASMLYLRRWWGINTGRIMMMDNADLGRDSGQRRPIWRLLFPHVALEKMAIFSVLLSWSLLGVVLSVPVHS